MNLKNLFKFLISQKKKEKVKFERIFSFVDYLNKEKIAPVFYKIQSAGTEPEVIIDNKPVLMFCSNNYLGLSTHPKVIATTEKALKKHGLGPGGSRFLCGNVDILEELDKKTAKLVGMEDAITFPAGYMANSAIFEAIMDPFMFGMPYAKGSGIIFSDILNHGSIIQGCRLSSSKKKIFKHNDFDDLEKKIKAAPKSAHKMIVTEGVFSPQGEINYLPRIAELAEKYQAILMIDDAHGVGVFGQKGGGSVEQFGLQKSVDILMGSYDKALGGVGGFLAGSKKIIEYLRIVSQPYIYSSAVPAAMAAGVIKAIEITMSEEGSGLRSKLFKNAQYLNDRLKAVGFKIVGDGKISVVPVLIGNEQKAIEFSDALLTKGIYGPSFRWPAVPKGQSRIRVTPMATHTKEQLDFLISTFKDVGKKIGII